MRSSVGVRLIGQTLRNLSLAAFCLLAFAAAAQAATVEVEVEGIEPRTGSVYVALCQGGLSEGDCRSGRDAPASAPRLRFVFEDVRPGVYAVAAFQDLDANGRLDRTVLGLPLEPYGFSGPATGQGGDRARPSFERAAFILRDPGLSLRVRLARALPRR